MQRSEFEEQVEKRARRIEKVKQTTEYQQYINTVERVRGN
jgi:hypothetical protein